MICQIWSTPICRYSVSLISKTFNSQEPTLAVTTFGCLAVKPWTIVKLVLHWHVVVALRSCSRFAIVYVVVWPFFSYRIRRLIFELLWKIVLPYGSNLSSYSYSDTRTSVGQLCCITRGQISNLGRWKVSPKISNVDITIKATECTKWIANKRKSQCPAYPSSQLGTRSESPDLRRSEDKRLWPISSGRWDGMGPALYVIVLVSDLSSCR